MDEVETFLQASPDSARRVLESLPLQSHWLPWQHARYCLLLSSALDRCGIDVQDDSLAQYAARYYNRLGGPVRRFYSFYYLGRVHENRGDRQSAMDAFLHAERIRSSRVPLRFRSALEMHIGAIYAQIFEFDKAIEANEKAADYAQMGGVWPAYGESLLRNAQIHLKYGRIAEADCCRQRIESMEIEPETSLRLSLMGLESKRRLLTGDSLHSIQHYNDSIILAYDSCQSLLPWVDFSDTYVRTGAPNKAFYAIQQYRACCESEADATYYAVLSEVLDSLGDLRGSLTAYKRYIEISDSLDLVCFHQDTKFLKERNALQLQASQRKVYIWIVLILFALAVSGLSAFLLRRRRENTRLKTLYRDLQEEYKDLQELPSRMGNLNLEASKLLGDRLKALACFFTNDTPKSLSFVSTQLETLTENRKDLLETIGLLYAVYRTDFTLALVEKGLTPVEIGYCCLIALGLRNGELSEVINREGVNNINSAIRKKLGIAPNSTKLGTVLRDMFGNSGPQ